MSNPVPGALALNNIADGALITASPHRNNYSAVQAAVNALIAALSGGAAGQALRAVDGTDVEWRTTGVLGATQINTGTVSYTAPAHTGGLRADGVGAGGGGGAANTTGAGVFNYTLGGGGGAASGAFIFTNIGTHTVAVGAAGLGATVAGNAGGNGSQTQMNDSLGAGVLNCNGGVGGAAGQTSSLYGASAGGAAGTGSLYATAGNPTRGGIGLSTSTVMSIGGASGVGILGGAGAVDVPTGTGVSGAAATGFGGGGAGGANTQNQAVGRTGGNGFNGLLVVVAYG